MASFPSIEQNKQSRNYNADERDSAEFVRLRDMIGVSRGAFRNWEYSAAMQAIGAPTGKSIISLGSYMCQLSVFLSRHCARFYAVDRVHRDSVTAWGNERGGWGADTIFLQDDFAAAVKDLPDASFDLCVSVGAIEHVDEYSGNLDGDSRAMEQIGRLLKSDGMAAITTEWGVSTYYDKDFIGGYCYNLASAIERLEKPSGLNLWMHPERRTRFLFQAMEFNKVLLDFPAMHQAKEPFVPALFVFEHPKPAKTQNG